jgi:acetolactate synthase-1/2/3 large subunit
LVSLAESLGAMVLTGYSWMNFPSDHPLCIGIEQIGGSRKLDAGYDEADVILVIDYAMPYVSSAPPPKPDAKILHIDVDPLTSGRQLWRRGADIYMKADSREAIPALEQALKSRATSGIKADIEARAMRIAARNDETRRSWRQQAEGLAGRDPISPDYLFYCINQLIDDDAIFVNHTLGHCASVTEQIVRRVPGTWFGCPSGMIGWATGAALGAASAAPGKTVVAAMTDGGFVWGCPTSTFWTAANYRFPFLAIVCNNDGYGAIRDIHPEFMRDDPPSERYIAETATNFQPDYAMIAQGAGALGRTVKKPEDVMPALREALDAVRSGKPAVLDVYIPMKR